jgi:hypothetical protein
VQGAAPRQRCTQLATDLEACHDSPSVPLLVSDRDIVLVISLWVRVRKRGKEVRAFGEKNRKVTVAIELSEPPVNCRGQRWHRKAVGSVLCAVVASDGCSRLDREQTVRNDRARGEIR